MSTGAFIEAPGVVSLDYTAVMEVLYITFGLSYILLLFSRAGAGRLFSISLCKFGGFLYV